MKAALLSVLGFCLGAFFGWDRPEVSIGDEEIVALSRRKIVDEKNRVVVEVDPVVARWRGRIGDAKSAGELRQIFGELDGSEVDKKLELQKLVLRRWAEVDPEDAVTFLRARNLGWQLIPVVFAKWMGIDAEKAMAGMGVLGNLEKKMKTMVLEELLKGDEHEVTLGYLRRTKSFELPWGVKAVDEWLLLIRARTDEMEEVILAQIESEGKSLEYRTRGVLKMLGAVRLEEGAEEAVKWAESLEKGISRYALDGVMEAWVKVDPKAVVAMVDEWASLEKPGQAMVFATNSLTRSIALELTKVDFAAALSWLDRRGATYGSETVGGVIGKKMRAGELTPTVVFDEIARMKDEHEVLRKAVFKSLWEGVKAEDVVGIVEMIEGKEKSRTKTLAMASLLRGLVEKQPLEAAKVIEGLAPGKERRAMVAEALRGHRKNSLAVDFLQALPTEEYGAAVVALFEGEPRESDVWGYVPEEYPGSFAERLREVSDAGARTEAMARLGAYWGAVDPVGALRWAGDLSREDQVTAMKEVTRGWSKQNAGAVTRYIEGLSDGVIRDGVISGLVAGAGELDPASTWEWGGMIQDESLRREARESVLKLWAEDDLEAASRALEGSGISRIEREELRAILEK